MRTTIKPIPPLTLVQTRQAKRAYGTQKYLAGRRGISWQLTFEEWIQWWIDSGRWHERGRGKGKYCMARHGDTGPYKLDNIECIPIEQNTHDGSIGKTVTQKTRNAISTAHKGKVFAAPTIDKMRQAKSCKMRKVRVAGVVFESIHTTAKHFSVDTSTVYNRVRSDRWDWDWA